MEDKFLFAEDDIVASISNNDILIPEIRDDYDVIITKERRGCPVFYSISGKCAVAYRMRNKRQQDREKCFRVWFNPMLIGDSQSMLENENERRREREIARSFYDRMRAIDAPIRTYQNDLPYFANFDYSNEAIVIRKNSQERKVPGMTMDWLKGDPLHEFIQAHANEKDKLEQLAHEFMTMCKKFKEHGISHGDLSSNNILVTEDCKIQLVDYDSFYCEKTMAGKNYVQTIRGTRGFQHPQRLKEVEGQQLLATANDDNFSQQVIYLSILAVCHNYEIANSYENALLFNGNDLDSVDTFKNSDGYKNVKNLKNEETDFYLNELEKAISSSLADVKSICDLTPNTNVMLKPNQKDNPRRGENGIKTKNKSKKSSTPFVPVDLVSWADGKLSGDKKKKAEILADFIISKKENYSVSKKTVTLDTNVLTSKFVEDRDQCVKLFKIMLARVEGWSYRLENEVVNLRDSFYNEFDIHIKDGSLTDVTFFNGKEKGFPDYLMEKTLEMQLAYLYALRTGPADSSDARFKEAKTKYQNNNLFTNIKILQSLIINYTCYGNKVQSLFDFIHEVRGKRNKKLHGKNIDEKERARVFLDNIMALFLLSVLEMALEVRKEETIGVLVKIRKNQEKYKKIEITGRQDGRKLEVDETYIVPNNQYNIDLSVGQCEFTATCDGEVESGSCTVERGSWIRNPQLIIIDFNKPEGPTPPPPPPPNQNRDESSFADYKEEKKKELLKKYGMEISEEKLKMISSLSYSEEKSLAGNKAAVDSLVIKIESQLKMENNPWRKIGYLIKVGLSWVDKHWQWCAGALCLIVIPVVLMSIFDGGNSVEISDGQAVPSLQGTWRVRLMEGQNVNEGATITQAGENNTQYNISIIRNDIPDDSPNMDYKFETALSVDWQKGIVTSPDLGEGTIEKESRSKNLKIVFDKWIFVSLKGY